MKTIHKFKLDPEGVVSMPADAEILAVQTQRDYPYIWAIVDPEKPVDERRVKVYGTGHQLPDKPGKYLGTFQLANGALVYHAFESQ